MSGLGLSRVPRLYSEASTSAWQASSSAFDFNLVISIWLDLADNHGDEIYAKRAARRVARKAIIRVNYEGYYNPTTTGY